MGIKASPHTLHLAVAAGMLTMVMLPVTVACSDCQQSCSEMPQWL